MLHWLVDDGLVNSCLLAGADLLAAESEKAPYPTEPMELLVLEGGHIIHRSETLMK